MEWIDREEWRREINLGRESCENIDILYINEILLGLLLLLLLLLLLYFVAVNGIQICEF